MVETWHEDHPCLHDEQIHAPEDLVAFTDALSGAQ